MRNAGSEIDSVREQPIADQRGADQDRAGDDARAHRDAAAGRARQVFGHGEEGRHQRRPDRPRRRASAAPKLHSRAAWLHPTSSGSRAFERSMIFGNRIPLFRIML